ncbi:MAG: hypothetical protein ACK58L_18810 [Planctomycetota bacterium]
MKPTLTTGLPRKIRPAQHTEQGTITRFPADVRPLSDFDDYNDRLKKRSGASIAGASPRQLICMPWTNHCQAGDTKALKNPLQTSFSAVLSFAGNGSSTSGAADCQLESATHQIRINHRHVFAVQRADTMLEADDQPGLRPD